MERASSLCLEYGLIYRKYKQPKTFKKLYFGFGLKRTSREHLSCNKGVGKLILKVLEKKALFQK